MHMCPPHAVGHQRMVEGVEDILEQAPALLGGLALRQRAHGSKQVAIGPLIVTGHRFQYFAVGHNNTFHAAGGTPAVERTKFLIPTLLAIRKLYPSASLPRAAQTAGRAPAASGWTTSPICLDLNSNRNSYNCVLTSSTWITIAPRAQGNFSFTASTMSPELRISPAPMIRHP